MNRCLFHLYVDIQQKKTKESVSLQTYLPYLILNILILVSFFMFKMLLLSFIFSFCTTAYISEYQKFKGHLSEYETFHCTYYVTYHGMKNFKKNDMFDLKLICHIGIPLHCTFFIPNDCTGRRQNIKT